MTDSAKDFIKKIDKVFNSDFTPETMKRAKYAFLDYICVTLAGAEYNREKINKYLALTDDDRPKYTVIGFDRKADLKDAVFINGLSAHSLDYDDGTNAGIIHLGSPVFSALVSLAEKYDIDTERFYRSVIAGYEASFSMAYSMQPKHKKMGYHATGTCGVIGTTLAVCYALGYTEEDKYNAFSTACVSAFGMLKVLDNDSELKPYNVAKTALMSVISARMAKAGFVGPYDPLGGDRGYFAMMTGDKDLVPADPLLDNIYAIERAYVKPYAACRYCHPAIEGAIRIRQRMLSEGVCIESIQKIEVDTYSLAVNGHDHCNIVNVSSAKMSIPYGVCVSLIYGKAGLYEYTDEIIEEKKVKDLLQKITVIADEDLNAIFPRKQVAKIYVYADGRTYTECVEFPKGERENPFTEEEFRDRFTQMCLYAGKTDNEIDHIYDCVSDNTISIKKIIELL